MIWLFAGCKKIKLLDVIGEAEGQAVLELNAVLKNPDRLVCNPIIDEKFEIQDLTKHVFNGQVIIQGLLVKNIIYKAIKDMQPFISHETVTKPFRIDIPVPGLRPGRMIGRKLIFSKNPIDDVHIQVHLVNIQSDTKLKPIKKVCDKPHSDCNQDCMLLFRNPALADKFHGEVKFNKKIPPKEKEIAVHEKVIITLAIIVAKFDVTTIPVLKKPPVFNCSAELRCDEECYC